MSKTQQVKQVLRTYVEALETNDMDKLAGCLSDDIVLKTTNYGNANGKQNVINNLRWQGLEYNYAKYKIFNFVCFTSGDKARSSCVVTALIGQDDPDYFHYFQFGGYYVIDYKLENNEWKMNFIKFNLDMEDGNSLFVKGWWKLIDYRLYEGSLDYPICPEYDAPWNAFEHPDDPDDVKEQVKDALFRYAWGIDHSDFTVLGSAFADNVRMVNEKKDGNISGLDTMGDTMNRDELIRFMKYKRLKEAVMEHIYNIVKIEVDGEYAKLEVYRYEPHRLGTTKLHKYNKDSDFYSGSFFYEFRHVEGTYPTGGWKMVTNGIRTLRTFADKNTENKRFYSDEN
jgi:hypothetical protein